MRDVTADLVRKTACRIGSAGTMLRALPPTRIANAIHEAATRLLGTDGIGAEARSTLPSATGLSAPMVEWALTTTLRTSSVDALMSMLPHEVSSGRARAHQPARLAAVVLAGNVFTASFRALLAPLLSRVPVVAKAPSRDDVFPRLFARAIAEADAEVGQAIDVVTFQGGTTALEDTLFAQCDVVAAYGSDTTLADIRARLPATSTFVPHGHGLGIAFVPISATANEQTRAELVRALALDVAAYDQRGCLSPHAIFVERGGGISGRQLAERLCHEGLPHEESVRGRGPLPLAIGAQQLQWRGIAAARGDLFEGDSWAVSFEGCGAFRLSPGYRNVSVIECNDTGDFLQRIAPLGVHLKCLGIAADEAQRDALVEQLPAPIAPRICEVGRMQTPELTGPADGMDPMFGFLRHIALR
ncbi:MAG: hypothetical protein IPK60_11890 [Sandaracinaceae bacterium]|nr:hypothetical protein [Sandaracinaceae bacterium]